MRDGSRERGAAGFSLLELMVTILILAVVFGVVTQSTLTILASNQTMESANTAQSDAQKAASTLQEDVATARKIFENDALGTSYLPRLAYGAIPRLGTTTLPTIDPLGSFGKDLLGAARTGNCLLVAAEMSPRDFTASDTKTYRVNVFRLICYYVGTYPRPVAYLLTNMDLVRWESEAFVDRTTLAAIANPVAQTEFAADLMTNAKINWAWDPGAVATAAFYSLAGGLSPTPNAAIVVPASPIRNSVVDRSPRAFFQVHNGCLAANNGFTGEAGIPKFALINAAPPGFPNGFEVKVIGQTGARQVRARIVAQRKGGLGGFGVGKAEITVTMRDL